MGKDGRKIYNYDGLAEFGDDATKTDMVDDKPVGTSHDALEGDAFMKDATHGYDHGNRFGVGFGDPSSSMTMLQNMQLRQDEHYEEDCRRRDAFEAAQVERFRLMQEHMMHKMPV